MGASIAIRNLSVFPFYLHDFLQDRSIEPDNTYNTSIECKVNSKLFQCTKNAAHGPVGLNGYGINNFSSFSL